MRIKYAVLVAAFVLACGGAAAQFSKPTLQSEITTQFPDNVTGTITPQRLRTVTADIVNSFQQFASLNAQSGVTYTIQATDYGKLVTLSNASAVAVTLPQAAGSFTTFNFYVTNLGAGLVTITPQGGSTLMGGTNITLQQGQGAWIVSDGTNWQAQRNGWNFAAGSGIGITAGLSPTIALSVVAAPVLNIAARFGSMDVWQRANGSSASMPIAASTTTYTVDGCYLSTGANEASTAQISSPIASGSYKSANVGRNNGQTGTALMVFGCPLDSDEIAQFAGQYVALSFTLQPGALWSPRNAGWIDYALICGTGSPKKQVTGFTGQSTPISASIALSASTAAVRYMATTAAVVPATCTQAEVQWNWSPDGTAGATDNITIDDVQLEVVANASTGASTFVKTPFQQQLAMAQRYYAKTFSYNMSPSQALSSFVGALFLRSPSTTVSPSVQWRFPQTMRLSPSVATYNPSTNNNTNCRDVTAGADSTAVIDVGNGLSDSSVNISCMTSTINDQLYVQATADAGL